MNNSIEKMTIPIPWVIGLGIFMLAVNAGYTELRVNALFAAKDLVDPGEITSIKEDVKENEDDIDDFQQRWNTFIDAIAASRIED